MKEQLINMMDCNDFNKIMQFFQNFDQVLYREGLSPEIANLFYKLMCKDYNGERVGDILLRFYLSYKIEITPSLISYLYLREKEKMNLKADYNSISFYLNGLACTDHKLKSFSINDSAIKEEYENKSIDELNYRIIEIILHELWHIYQFTIDKNSNNPLEQLILNDIEIFKFLVKKVRYLGLHDLIFMIEHEADEYAHRTAIDMAKKENWFSEEFIAKKEEKLLKYYQSNIFMRDQNNQNLVKIVESLKVMLSYDDISLGANEEEYKKYVLSINNLLEDIKPLFSKEAELIEIISKIPNEDLAKINLGIISPLDLEQNASITPDAFNVHKSI